MNSKIVLLGCGFMAHAIACGLIQKSVVPPENITVINAHNPAAAVQFASELGCNSASANAVGHADAVIICFKPQAFKSAMPEYACYMQPGQLLISIMAGIGSADIYPFLPAGVDLILAMPNLALSVGLSATGITPCSASPTHLSLCNKIFSSLGTVNLLNEDELPCVTAIAGSSPAYFYYLAESMIHAAVSAGMEESIALDLCKQAFIGTAELWKKDTAAPEEMRRRITSAKGTTDAAIRAMSTSGFAEAVEAGMNACRSRFAEMGSEMMK